MSEPKTFFVTDKLRKDSDCVIKLGLTPDILRGEIITPDDLSVEETVINF